MMMFASEINMSEAVQFVTRLSVVVLFSCMILGVGIKKLLQLML